MRPRRLYGASVGCGLRRVYITSSRSTPSPFCLSGSLFSVTTMSAVDTLMRLSDPVWQARLQDPTWKNAYDTYHLREVVIAFMILETVFVNARFASKHIGKNAFGMDDALLTAGWVFCQTVNILCLVVLDHGGIGHHLLPLLLEHPGQVTLWAKFLIVIPIMYAFAVSLPKIAILVFYRRIFTERRERFLVWVCNGIIIANLIVAVLGSCLACIPLNALWDPTVKGRCYDITASFRYISLPNIITDFVMLVLPLPTVWKLQVPKRTKVGLAVTLLTGSVGLITSILRTVVFFNHDGVIDGTWTSPILLVWTVVEPGCYCIASSLMCMRPLLNLIFNKALQVASQRSRSVANRVGMSLSSDSKIDVNRVPGSRALRDDEPSLSIPLRAYPLKNHIRYERQSDDEALVGMEQYHIYHADHLSDRTRGSL
ncbi:hypothetical protein K461DRAFT_148314 [Myriangium duriaei CBS 260.36]|uniref:Rhodopsin domain-containing protein n=1 Tax=Myriangium duriaei CBS 260.36 TaxID=1168546 RepID=A0A9P4MFL2_9PEZI|nr:hypothetical protein K461DRAFT_148314 [Myriangium duriaei CBS 260.36]